jgi:hypothetical protein
MTDTTNAANSSPITAGDAGNSLMPCPFCGGEATLRPQGNAYTKSRKITVKCKDCRVKLTHAAIHYGFDWLAEKIERDWNRRAAPQPQGGALTDEQIREVAVDYCRFVFPGVYSIREFDCEEDFFNCVRAIVAQSAPSAPQQAGDGLTDEQYQAISCCIADYRCEPEVEPNISILRGLRSLLAAPRQPGEMGAGVEQNTCQTVFGQECRYAKDLVTGRVHCIHCDRDKAAASAQQDEREAFRELRQRVRSVILDHGRHQPEEDETWESWHAASYDLLGSAVFYLFEEFAPRFSAQQVHADPKQDEREALMWAVISEKYGMHIAHYCKPKDAEAELAYWRDQWPDGGKLELVPLVARQVQADAGVVALPNIDTLRKGFKTSRVCGPENIYEINIQYRSIEDLHAAEDELTALMRAAMSREQSQEKGGE